MKPTKNRVFCKDCGRLKMLFESEKKADTFIKFNSTEIEEESGFKPERSYYCVYCAGWHTTSQKDYIEIKSKTEVVVDLYQKRVDFKKVEQQRIEPLLEEIKERLKSSFDVVLKNIEFLESPEAKFDKPKFKEILNLTIIEFDKIKSIGVNTKGRRKQEKIVNLKIKNFKKDLD